VIVGALIFTCTIPGLKSCKETTQKIEAELEFWSIGDDQRAYEPFLDNFQSLYPGVEVNHRSFASEEAYATTLLQSLAAGQGPDVFMISNRSLPKNIAKLAPLPSTRMNLIQLRELFPQVVEQDFAPEGRIYALPASIDTLALLYNRDLIDQAGISVPETWEEFQSVIPRLTELEDGRRIIQAGAAIGTSNRNIEQATDILNLLMLQSGTIMVDDEYGEAKFASSEGVDALRFYAQFSNARNEVYTWNSGMPNALDSFARGNTAMIFEYAGSIPEIRERNSFLNIGIAPAPQPESAKVDVSYPHYWGFAVSRQSRNAALAWELILSITTNPETVSGYLNATNRPPALRSLITGEYANDPDLHVFARQALTARSWAQADPDEIQDIFSNVIDLVNTNQQTPARALQEAEETVTNLMRNSVY